MGADLYIQSLYCPNNEEWQQRFDDAVRARDALGRETPEYEEAQERVSECFEKMYSVGYFRDPYNDSNLLWKFRLSWWQDVATLLDRDHRLLPDGATEFLGMLHEREPVFESELRSMSVEERRYFEEEYRTLQAFLNEAIARDEPIECSI